MPAEHAAAHPAPEVSPARRSRDDAGFSLVEVLVALGIVSTVMAATGPFLVTSLNTMGAQRTRQAAIQVANDAVERARALRGPALLNGRGKKAAREQWDAAPAAAKPLLDLSTLDADPDAANDAGDQAPLPTKAQTVTIDKIDYVRSWYVGRCWQPATKRDDPTAPDPALNAVCAGSKKPSATDVPFFRVVVAVTWKQPSCPAGRCVYVTATLISSTTDPIFAIKRPPPRITDPGTLVVYRTEPVNRSLAAVGGVLPLAWTATGLPAGLSLSGSGLLSGTPTTNGTTTVTANVADQEAFTDTRQFAITVVDPLVVTAPAAQTARLGTAASLSVPASGGQSPLAFSAKALPAGLSIDAGTGVVTGTPTAWETTKVTVTVTDRNAREQSAVFDWRVLTPVQVTNPGDQSATIGSSVTVTLAASGGAGPYTWRADNLPYGLSIAAGTGVVSGTVTRGTRYLSTVYVADSAGMEVSTTFVFSAPSALGLDLSVTAPAPAMPNQVTAVGATVSLAATASNAPLGVNTWTAANLPPGLTISAAAGTGGATISGKPTVKGVYPVTLTVRDSTNRYAYEMFTWTVQ